MVFLQDATLDDLLRELAIRRAQIDKNEVGAEAVRFSSANACSVGLDLTTSWSDGKEGSPVQGCSIVKLTWDHVSDFVTCFGFRVDGGLVSALSDAVDQESSSSSPETRSATLRDATPRRSS